jgi:hypothetical protein
MDKNNHELCSISYSRCALAWISHHDLCFFENINPRSKMRNIYPEFIVVKMKKKLIENNSIEMIIFFISLLETVCYLP